MGKHTLAILMLMLTGLAPAAFAGGDPDQGMSRAWNREDPGIGKAYYI